MCVLYRQKRSFLVPSQQQLFFIDTDANKEITQFYSIWSSIFQIISSMHSLQTTSKFLDISNILAHSQSSKKSQPFMRRKSDAQNVSKRKSELNKTEDKKLVCFIPMNRIDRSASQLFKQSINPMEKIPKENSATKQIGDLSFRKFNRHKQRKAFQAQSCLQQSQVYQACGLKVCKLQMQELQQKHLKAMSQVEGLKVQNDKLKTMLVSCNNKITQFSDLIKTKTVKIQQLRCESLRYYNLNKHLEDTLQGRDRMISKLQDIVKNYEKKAILATKIVSQPKNQEMSKIIHQLKQKLKYKEIDSHLLKKQRETARKLQQENKALSKEVTVLKERLSYYMRQKKDQNSYLRESISSISSLSLSLASSTGRLTDRLSQLGKQTTDRSNDSKRTYDQQRLEDVPLTISLRISNKDNSGL